MLKKVLIFIPLLVFLLNSCSSDTDAPLFKELSSEESGIDFFNVLSNSDSFNIVDFLYYYDGGGVALGDINNDGLTDIYLASNEGSNALFLNQGDLNFKDITESAGVGSPGSWKSGISMVDINADGLLDLYVCRLGDYKWVEGHNELYINQGDLTFKEESAKYNLGFSGYSTQAAFFDMDKDGDLDAYLLNHSVHTERSIGPTSLRADKDPKAGDRLFRNDNGYFIDVTESSGIYSSQVGFGLGIGLTDINDDGYTDIYVTNDFLENDYFYFNNGDGTFSESYSQMTTHTSLSSMGNDIADINNDGYSDIITLDMLPSDEVIRKSTVGDDPHQIFRMKIDYGYMKQYSRNTLQLNLGDGTFSEIGMLANVHATDWSWAPLFADFDNDGLKDLFISNGIVTRPNDLNYIAFIEREDIRNNPSVPDENFIKQMPEGKARNYFFRNNGDLTFNDVSEGWVSSEAGYTNGAAYGDLDNDGDIDLVLNNLNTRATILENLTGGDSSNNYLNIQLMGDDLNSMAIGSKVWVYEGNTQQYLENYPVRGFKSSVDYRLHVGLGSNSIVDSIVVQWPDDMISKLYEIQANQHLIIEKQTSRTNSIVSTARIEEDPVFIPVEPKQWGIDYRHQENTFIEFNREGLIPHMNSMEGPALAVADIDNDGMDDFFIGGAKHQEGQVFTQTQKGFVRSNQEALTSDKTAEDVDAEFFDFENDGDLDLLVVSGGNEFAGEDENRQPRLYLNDGNGIFFKKEDIFRNIYQNGSVVATGDFNKDGFVDIFLGSHTIPWNYGLTPQSFLLQNDQGKGFTNVSELLPNNGTLGMINDAHFVDIDSNGEIDLLVAGEWMNIQVLLQRGHEFTAVEIRNSSGWWKSIAVMDYDDDGDLDIIGANLGLNSKLKATPGNPILLYVNDFDDNGRLDQILTYYTGGKESIFNSWEDVKKQIPSITNFYASSHQYALDNPKDFMKIKSGYQEVLSAEELRSGVFINNGNTNPAFSFSPFPNPVQVTWMQDILIHDINGDNEADILIAGNTSASSIQQGWYLSGQGNLLVNSPEGFQLVDNLDYGLNIAWEVRVLETIIFQNKMYILIARNNDPLQILRINQR